MLGWPCDAAALNHFCSCKRLSEEKVSSRGEESPLESTSRNALGVPGLANCEPRDEGISVGSFQRWAPYDGELESNNPKLTPNRVV